MNEYLNQIEISGITYDLVASGGTESGVTPAEVQEMINQSISGMSGDINIISGDVKNISSDVISISGDVISLSGDVQNISGDVIVLSGDVIALEAKVDTKMDKLPIYSGTGLNSLVYNYSGNTASGNYSHAEGYANRATNTASHVEGTGCLSSGGFAHAEGRNTQATQLAAHAEGTNTAAKGVDSHAEGTYTIANNQSEHASGYYNVSRTGSTDAEKTLFSVGNGTSAERHNAFEIRQNGDIFISSGGTDIKLQDVIGQGGITSGDVVDIVSEYTYDKETIDNKIASGGTFDPTLYYKKSETSGKTELSTEFEKYYKKTETSGKTEIQNALDLKLDASAFTESDYYKKTETSGKTELSTEFAKYYKKDETSGKTELSNEFALYYKKDETSGKTELADEFEKYYEKTETSSKTEIDDAFSAITKVIEDNEEVVARALNELNDKKVESGDVIDIVSGYTYSKAEIDDALDDKQDLLVAGDNIIITGNVISAVMSGGSGVTSGQVQMMIDQSISGISGNTNVISGDVKTLSGDVKNISGDVVTISGDVKGLETKIDALSGKVDDKQDKLVSGVNIKTINNQSLLGSGNITISGGSGSTYTAGRGINISGNVISFNLPISAGTGIESVVEGDSSVASGGSSHAEGWLTKANGSQAHAEGWLTVANGNTSHAEGYHTEADNYAEHASGQFNISSTASTSFGNSGNTLFSIGNGSGSSNKHNALEVKQDGSIYIPDLKGGNAYYDRPMIKLQDALSQSGVTSGDVETMINQSISGKADSSDVYLKNETYTKTEVNNAISNKIQCLSEAEWEQTSGSTVPDTLYLIY